MKQFYSLMVLSFFISSFYASLFAQIPNADFEDWPGADPAGWFTSNIAQVFTNITQSSDAQSGSSAMRGEVINLGGNITPFAISGEFPEVGFPINDRPTRLTGWYQFSPEGGDQLVIETFLADTVSGEFGEGLVTISSAAGSYTQFVMDITYSSSTPPNWAEITFIILNNGDTESVNVGSTFLIDNLSFGTAVGIETVDDVLPNQFSLSQNYPNPFNPATTIQFSIPQASDVHLAIFNQLGQEVDVIVNDRFAAGSYAVDWNAVDLPSGAYFYRIRAGEFTAAKKLILMK